MKRLAPIAVGALSLLCGCHAPIIALHAPDVAPAASRHSAVVDLEPIADATASAAPGSFSPPGPSAVLTNAIAADMAGRALEGGEPGGYKVRCSLDRFAIRWRAALAEGSELLLVYVDLSCEARRVADGAIVWRGALRGRTAAQGPNIISSDADVTQRLADRAISDASREIAGDLALRALGLSGQPSSRVFGDEGQLHDAGGLDDTPYGPAALAETSAAVEGAMRALGEHEATMRAAAWNIAAMAAGPGEAWTAGAKMALDDDALVRFVQYKALARQSSAAAIQRLQQALEEEDHPLLAEFVRDAVALRGIGLARKGYVVRGDTNASPATKGTTASP